MRNLMLVVFVGATVFAIWHWRSSSVPSAQQVEPLLKAYLVSRASGNCSGAVTLEALDDVSVGEYSSEFGGWPVYANHRETCHQGTSSMTYDGSKNVEEHVAAAFVRRTTTGRLEAYLPSIFVEGQRQMEQSFQNALSSMQTR